MNPTDPTCTFPLHTPPQPDRKATGEERIANDQKSKPQEIDQSDIISHSEMCHREGRNLQQGMNFQAHAKHSVILMSRRSNAPYEDEILDDGSTIIYEGHDVPRDGATNPKQVDQLLALPNGAATENGKFYAAAKAAADGTALPRRVRVYEKSKPDIWSYNGVFHLVDAWLQESGGRTVVKFKLIAVEGEENFDAPIDVRAPHRRLIPSWVKREVFKRDEGQCVKCGSRENLHYDHELPFSRGGSSLTPENIQLLCGKHNLEKRDRIE